MASLEYGGLIIPPFYGTGEMLTWQVEGLLESIDIDVLYNDYLKKGTEGNKCIPREKCEDLSGAVMKQIRAENLIDARGYYCFYPIITHTDDIIILDPNDYHSEIMTISIPRQSDGRSVADYFRPEMDILPVLVATIGPAFENCKNRYAEKNDPKHHSFHSIGKYLTDIIADKIAIEIRRSLSLERTQGIKCSFGDTAMPDPQKQVDLVKLICAEDRLGITFSNTWSLQPQYSTVQIFCYHQDAEYF